MPKLKDMQYTRKGAVITNYTGKKPKADASKSINQAKKRSHALQMLHDGALGRGTVRAIK